MKLISRFAELSKRVRQTDVLLLSESLAFSTLLSIVPFMAVALTILHSLTGTDLLTKAIEMRFFEFFQSTAGGEAVVILKKVMRRLSSTTWTLAIATALFLASLKLMMDIDRAMNHIWGSQDIRPYWMRFVRSVIFYFTIPIGLAAYVGVRSAATVVPLIKFNPSLADTLLIFIALALLNKWVPARKIRWGYVLIAAGASTLGLAFVDNVFVWLTKQVFQYSKLYGSLAALPLLCLGILMIWQIILFGTAIAASLAGPSISPRR